MIELTRRGLIGGAAAAALLPASAHAQASQLVVGTWGGDYGDLLREGVDGAIMKPLGIEVLQDISSPVPRRTKLLAERQSRRGSMDVACLADFDMFAATQLSALEEVSEANTPRLANGAALPEEIEFDSANLFGSYDRLQHRPGDHATQIAPRSLGSEISRQGRSLRTSSTRPTRLSPPSPAAAQ